MLHADLVPRCQGYIGQIKYDADKKPLEGIIECADGRILRFHEGRLNSPDRDIAAAEYPDGRLEFLKRSILHRDPDEGPAIWDPISGAAVYYMNGKQIKSEVLK